MLWPILTILALAGLLILHLWWRGRFLAAQEAAGRAFEQFNQTREHTAREIQNRQETLFNSMAEGLLWLDQDGRIQLANRAFTNLFGVISDIRSRTIIEALRLHELEELVDSLSAEKQVLGRELKLSRPNERVLEVNAAAIFNGGGRRDGTILVFHDLTRLKQLERGRQEFVANVSHELRTPLSLIKGYVETLLDGAKDNPEVAARFLQTIDRNAERLRLLIEDLLTISELESGRVKLNLQSVLLQNVVEKVLADFKSRAQAKQVRLVEEVPELVVRADADRLEQVVFNLVDNAIKYGGRAEGVVTVGARPVDGSQVELCVRDDGPGIPPEALERVFERFYRVDKARSREQGGTGLGLSIVKHIVQSHGGRVWAKSEPGQGAAFFFTLPQDSGGLQQPLL
ncbi:MAG TPA: ATP-binding protein [Candidatus Binatia bacterium]|jgi:two-component system phosphate regulon sensor histidine kinase PhoR|nr:ATP-binding protein [Candidatus Binatia bacterium]